MRRHDPRRTSDVEQRPSSASGERSQEFCTLGRVLALLGLDRARIDEPAVERADEGTIHAVVETRVRLRCQARVQKDKTALAARVRLRRVAIPDPMREDDELACAIRLAGL